MTRDALDRFYRKVPQELKEQLERFRAARPFKVLAVDDVTWQYISCGQGQQAILLLPGGTGFGEGFFRYILALDAEYRLVSPMYPPVSTMGRLTDGLVAILEAEGIRQANILGQSLGGMAAQVLVRKHPSKVNSLILSQTTTTSPPVDQAIALERQKEIETFQRLLPFLPLWLLRSVSRRRLFRHLSGMEAEDKEFWKAYLSEMLSFVSKEYVLASVTFDRFE
jgi:pimeloyl-ACP methyl ester carboxylesterase